MRKVGKKKPLPVWGKKKEENAMRRFAVRKKKTHEREKCPLGKVRCYEVEKESLVQGAQVNFGRKRKAARGSKRKNVLFSPSKKSPNNQTPFQKGTVDPEERGYRLARKGTRALGGGRGKFLAEGPLLPGGGNIFGGKKRSVSTHYLL